MRHALRAIAVSLLIAITLVSAFGSVRWAKRGGTAASLMASALMLGLGMGIVVQPPQQGIEQAEEKCEKTGGESGEPLT